ncbi:hypothetical protein CFOL_v3_31156, partial [Cephalotus follicularis]
KKFRTRGIHPELKDKLRTMFSTVAASGSFVDAPSSGVAYADDANAVEGVGDSHITDLNLSDDDIAITQAPPQVPNSQGRKKPKSRSKKGNKKSKEKVSGATKMTAQIDRLIDLVESESQVGSVPTVEKSNCSIPMVINKLENLEDSFRGSELYMFVTRLFYIREKRETFLALGEDLTSLWIRSEFANKGI